MNNLPLSKQFYTDVSAHFEHVQTAPDISSYTVRVAQCYFQPHMTIYRGEVKVGRLHRIRISKIGACVLGKSMIWYSNGKLMNAKTYIIISANTVQKLLLGAYRLHFIPQWLPPLILKRSTYAILGPTGLSTLRFMLKLNTSQVHNQAYYQNPSVLNLTKGERSSMDLQMSGSVHGCLSIRSNACSMRGMSSRLQHFMQWGCQAVLCWYIQLMAMLYDCTFTKCNHI